MDIGKANQIENKVRVYEFPNKQFVRLENVIELVVRESGTHRLKTSDGKLHIISPGWLHIEIENADQDWKL